MNQPPPAKPSEQRISRTTWMLFGLLAAIIVLASAQSFLHPRNQKKEDPLAGDSDDAMGALSTQLSHTPAAERKPLLLHDVEASTSGLRYSAVDALDKEKGVDVADALEKAFRDNASIVRQRAMETLLDVNPERGLLLLLAGLHDEDRWIREAAIQQVVSRLGKKSSPIDRRAVPTLIQTLDDPDSVLPITAMNALRKLTGQPWHAKQNGAEAEKRAAISAWKHWWTQAARTWTVPPPYQNVSPIRPERADPAPDFQLQDTDGHTVRLADQRGRVTLLNFWGTWCPPCQVERPDLIKLDQTEHPHGLDIIGVALGETDGPEGLHRWCKAHDIAYRQALAPADMLEAYGHIHEVPVSVLIDAQGKIRYQWEGERDFATFQAAVDRLLQEKKTL